MANFLAYQCSVCGTSYGLEEVQYACPQCGDLGNLDIRLDYAAINRVASPQSIAAPGDFSIWRYLPLLPLDLDHFNELRGAISPVLPNALCSVGWTPLYRANLGMALGLKHLCVKDEGRNPTASFK